MKTFFAVLLLVAAVSAAPRALCNANSEHTIIRGVCEGPDKDKLVYQNHVEIPAKLFPIPGSNIKDIVVPEAGGLAAPIKCIKIIDKIPDNHGGCPSLPSGGVADNFVRIHLLSQFARDMSFDIQVYTAL